MQESTTLLTREAVILERFPQLTLDPKPIYDILGILFSMSLCLSLIVLSLPIIAACSALILLTDPGPIFYRQQRVGKNGKIFWIWKLRTMVQNAEVSTGAVLSIRNDSRVTWIGKVLRNSHLDELPQLYNILRGEMGFIGPRPERPELIEKIKMSVPDFSLRNKVRPGVTGLAQISGEYDLAPAEKLQYDLMWIKDRQSFRLNAWILFQTFKNLFTNRFNR